MTTLPRARPCRRRSQYRTVRLLTYLQNSSCCFLIAERLGDGGGIVLLSFSCVACARGECPERFPTTLHYYATSTAYRQGRLCITREDQPDLHTHPPTPCPPQRGETYQPRATPWNQDHKHPSPGRGALPSPMRKRGGQASTPNSSREAAPRPNRTIRRRSTAWLPLRIPTPRSRMGLRKAPLRGLNTPRPNSAN